MLHGGKILKNQDNRRRKKALRPILLLLPLFSFQVILIRLKRKSLPASLAYTRQEKDSQREEEHLPLLTKGDEEGLQKLQILKSAIEILPCTI
jgi:hypothetical protein